MIAFQLVAGQNPDTTGSSNDGRVTWHRDWTPTTSTSATVAFDRDTSLLVPRAGHPRPQHHAWSVCSGSARRRTCPLTGPITCTATERSCATRTALTRSSSGSRLSRRQYNGYRSDSSRPDIAFQADAINYCHHQSPAGLALFDGHFHRRSVGRISQLGYVVLCRRHLARGPEPHRELWASLRTQPGSQ